MARYPSTKPKKSEWSFPWRCAHCSKPMTFLVAEIAGVPAYARCPGCTSLIEVSARHRALRVDRD